MREKNSFNYPAAVCAAISIILLFLSVSGFVHSARAVLAYIFYPPIYHIERLDFFLRGVPDNFRQLFAADNERRALVDRIKALEIENSNLRENAAEANRLRAALGLSESLAWHGIWARVIGRDSNNWYGFLTIDKGQAQGVRVNDTVIASQNGEAVLAGRVYEVFPKFSRIMLPGHKAFSIIASIGRGGKDILAEGMGSAKLKLAYIPDDMALLPNTEVFSAPSASLYLPNLKIGVLGKIYKRDSEISPKQAEVLLSADMEALKELYIVHHKLPDDLIPPAQERP